MGGGSATLDSHFCDMIYGSHYTSDMGLRAPTVAHGTRAACCVETAMAVLSRRRLSWAEVEHAA